MIGNTTNKASPTVRGFPDVRVLNKAISPTSKALIAAVCKAYKGSKPAACSDTLN